MISRMANLEGNKLYKPEKVMAQEQILAEP